MSNTPLIDVPSLLPRYLRSAIPYQTFNRVQSECLEAWSSDENLLVSAPTGSGKTVCLELAILRHVHKVLEFSDAKRLGSNGFNGKAVFIAPTKALCSEKQEEWRNKFSFIGLRVEAVTGDIGISASDSKLSNADLILTTAEKWDSVTRNIGFHNTTDLTSQISLLLLDEVHQVGDSRGATFESVVTRMLVASDESRRTSFSLPVSHLRVIAVSATIGNMQDVGQWLRVKRECIKEFDASYRPVDLEYKVIGFNIRNRWQASKVYDSRMLQALHQFGDKKPALVFCSSRRQTAISAKALVESLKSNAPDLVDHGNELTSHLLVEQRRRLFNSAMVCQDKVLANLLPNGVAIHNAEMNLQNRHLVERLFGESLIQCLFATSTLAQGVNLPARLVVIAGTAVYHDGELKEYDQNMLLQMCGRAGRAGLDSRGTVAIMTAASTVALYENIGRAKPAIVKSQLVSCMEECFNAEIARQSITDVPTAVSYLKKTFFWVQEEKKGGQTEENGREQTDSRAASVVLRIINRLTQTNLVFHDEDRFGLGSTVAGKYMAKYCLSFSTMKYLTEEIPSAFSPLQILRVIASTADALKDVVIRRSEKKKLNEWKENLRLPVRGKVKDPTDKVVILLQMLMGDQLDSSNVEFSFRSEALHLSQSISRICGCLISLILDHGLELEYASLFAVLQLCRSLPNRTFWDGPTVLRQIPGITTAYARLLNKKGIHTIETLASISQDQIDNIVAANAPVGQRICEHLRTLPNFHLRTEVHRDPSRDNTVVRIDVNVTLSAQIGRWGPRQRRGERGFVLVGSHARGLIDVQTFGMDATEHNFSFDVPPDRDSRLGKWIDIQVGCENVVGTDKKVTIHLDRVRSEFGSEVLPSKGASLRNSLRQSSNLSVTCGRVSKRRIQTTVSQALTRGFLKTKTLRTPSHMFNKPPYTVSLESRENAPTEQHQKEPLPLQGPSDFMVKEFTTRAKAEGEGKNFCTAPWEGGQNYTGTEDSAENQALIGNESKESGCALTPSPNPNTTDLQCVEPKVKNVAKCCIAREYDDAFKSLF